MPPSFINQETFMKVFIAPYTQYHVEEERHRQVDVEIHDYDMWSLDHTLAKIIYPALLKFRETVHSFPMVDDADAPDGKTLNGIYDHELKGIWTEPAADDEEQEARDLADVRYTRWLYVLDEMIFSFHCLYTDNAWEDEYYERGYPREEMNVIEERISNGFRLFGKYYRSLWN
jgi:hypothetical protein